jgi:hypothetical protein
MLVAENELLGFNDLRHVRLFHRGALPFGARLNWLVPRDDEIILAGADLQPRLPA